jgi:hypothetical protein
MDMTSKRKQAKMAIHLKVTIRKRNQKQMPLKKKNLKTTAIQTRTAESRARWA